LPNAGKTKSKSNDEEVSFVRYSLFNLETI